MKSFQAQTHYEVLEISVGATLAEIRSAYERLTLLYSDDQVALYGLIDSAQSGALRVRLQQALEVLTNEARREAYDLTIGLPPRVVAQPPPPAPKPVGSSAGTGWGGAITWVTPSAPAQPTGQPSAYTYAVTPTRAVASVPVPARILAVVGPARVPAPSPLPQGEGKGEGSPVAVEPAPEPRQLALDVTAGVAQWGAKAVESVAEIADPPVTAPEVVAAPAPVEPQELERPDPPVAAEPIAELALISARAAPNREFRVEKPLRPYEIPEGVEINGDLLRQVRLAKGLSLVQVADRTRIGVKHLENVESDRYDALPAAVYLRGILMNLARELGLDGLRVSRSYLTFVEAHRSKG